MKLEDKSTSQLKDKAWKIVSKYMRLKFPICEICRHRESIHVHHIIKRSKGNALLFDEKNLLSLCKDCHDNIHTFKKWRIGFDDIERVMILTSLRTKKDLEYLQYKKHGVYKFEKGELIDIIKDYKQRVKEIEKDN